MRSFPNKECGELTKIIGELSDNISKLDLAIRHGIVSDAYGGQAVIEEKLIECGVEPLKKFRVIDTEIYQEGGEKKLPFLEQHFPMALSLDGRYLATLENTWELIVTDLKDPGDAAAAVLQVGNIVGGEFCFGGFSNTLYVQTENHDKLARFFRYDMKDRVKQSLPLDMNFFKNVQIDADGAIKIVGLRGQSVLYDFDGGLAILDGEDSEKYKFDRGQGYKKSKILEIDDFKGNYIYTYHEDGAIKVWDVNRKKYLFDLKTEQDIKDFRFYGLDFAVTAKGDEKGIILAGKDDERWLFQLRKGSTGHFLPICQIGKGFLPNRFCLDDHGDRAFFADKNGSGMIMDLHTQRLRPFYQGTPETRIMKISYSSGILACGCADGRVRLYKDKHFKDE